MPIMIGLSLSIAGGGGIAGPSIVITSSDVDEDATTGTAVGVLSVANPPDGVTYTFTITADPDAKFDLNVDGETLETDAALDYETATSHSVTIQAEPDDMSDTLARTFSITVNNVFEAANLSALTLSNSSILTGSAAGTLVGAIQNKTTGSSLSLTDDAGGRFAIDGTDLEAGATATDINASTSHNVTIRETLADSANSPRDTTLAVTVTDETDFEVIADMFSTKSGAWFDDSDSTSMRNGRDGSGTVTSGTAVGWQYDLSQSGGLSLSAAIAAASNVVSNGAFDSGTSWTAGTGVAIGGGTANFTASSGTLTQSGILTASTTFNITFDVTVTSGSLSLNTTYFDVAATVTTSGPKSYMLKTKAGVTDLVFTGSSFTGSIDNVVVKAISGSHRVAASDAARPVYTDSTLKWLDNDGLDDQLAFTIPTRGATSYIGTSCATTDTQGMVLASSSDLSYYVWAWLDGNTSTSVSGSTTGTPTYYIDNSVASLTDRDDAHDAIAIGGAHVAESISVDLTATQFANMNLWWSTSVSFRADVLEYGVVITDSAPSAAQRTAIQNWLAERSGATLA